MYLLERVCGKGLQVHLELLSRHLPQGMPIRDQFKVKLVAGGLKLLKQVREVGLGASLAILEPHAVFTQFCPSLLSKFIEFSGEIGPNLVEPIERAAIGCVVSLNSPSKKIALKADGEIEPAPVDQVPERFTDRIELPGDTEDPGLQFRRTNAGGTKHRVLSVEELPVTPSKDPFLLGKAPGQGRPGHGGERKELGRGEP